MMLIECLAAAAPSSAAIRAGISEMEAVSSYYADDDLWMRIMLTRDPGSAQKAFKLRSELWVHYYVK
jgi:hypothetical protein